MAAPNLNTFLSKILAQVQAAEDAAFSVFKGKLLGFATGATLDIVGRLVGTQRNGLDDDAFRKAIRLQIFINSSKGTPEDLIYVARSLTGFQEIQYYDIPLPSGAGGNFRLVIPGWTPDDGTIAAFLQSICPAGVRLLGVTPTLTGSFFRMGNRMKRRLFEI